MKNKAEQSVKEYSEQLVKLGIENKILEHSASKSIDEVVNSLGLIRSDSAATLIMKAGNEFIAIIRRDDTRLNTKNLKKVLDVNNLRIATDEEFIKITGQTPGAATYYNKNISRVLIDKRVFEKEYIVGGSGSFSSSISHKTSNLTSIPGSEVVDICDIALITTSSNQGVKRVLSGIRATGRLHLGNYLGAVKGMIELQNNPEYETLYCVVDLHATTTPYDLKTLHSNSRGIIIDYLACGLDSKKSALYIQSDLADLIPQLAFYFSTAVSVARMQHLPTFKEKVKQHPDNVTMALLNYPILMAADILIYKAGLVPVGIDQEPHLEIAREVARKMNDVYGTNFPEPMRFATQGEYVPSLTGEGKMSKSVEGSFINISDDFETIKKKIRAVPTSTYHPSEKTGGIKTLFTLLELFAPDLVKEFEEGYQSGVLQFVILKDKLSERIFEELKPIQEKRKYFEENPQEVDRVIKEGAQKARKIAEETIKEVKQKMGFE